MASEQAPLHSVRTVKARAEARRTFGQRVADRIPRVFGSAWFLALHVVWFAGWIAWNLLPGTPKLDRFPFSVLTMTASLEAIFLAIFVLIAQNRVANIDELRAEIDLHVNRIAEQELTKLLQIVSKIAEHHGIDLSSDHELRAMIAPTNLAKLEHELVKQIAPVVTNRDE
jgi:uncharacterized membrane protein